MHSKTPEIPRPALLLGVGGLLPFVATAIAVWHEPEIGNTVSSELPPWFGRLRLILTSGAVISLAIALTGISLG